MIYNWDGFGYWEDNVGRLATKMQPEYPHLGVHRPNNLGNLPFGESRRQRRHGLGSGRHLVPCERAILSPLGIEILLPLRHRTHKRHRPRANPLRLHPGPSHLLHAPNPHLLRANLDNRPLHPAALRLDLRALHEERIRIQRLHGSIH
jgi:hypothetical protein